jgi:hypothetical protein
MPACPQSLGAPKRRRSECVPPNEVIHTSSGRITFLRFQHQCRQRREYATNRSMHKSPDSIPPTAFNRCFHWLNCKTESSDCKARDTVREALQGKVDVT